MATRIFTTFLVPLDDDPLENNKGAYWVDVEEDYDKVFSQVFPLGPPTSSLEARANLQYNKVDGGQFAVHPQNVCAVEELKD